MGFWSNLMRGQPKQEKDIMVERKEGNVTERIPLSWEKEKVYKETYEKKREELELAKARKEAAEKAEREVNPPVRQNPFGFQNWARGTGVSHATHKLPPPAFLKQTVAPPRRIQPPQIRPPRNFTEFMQRQFGGGGGF